MRHEYSSACGLLIATLQKTNKCRGVWGARHVPCEGRVVFRVWGRGSISRRGNPGWRRLLHWRSAQGQLRTSSNYNATTCAIVTRTHKLNFVRVVLLLPGQTIGLGCLGGLNSLLHFGVGRTQPSTAQHVCTFSPLAALCVVPCEASQRQMVAAHRPHQFKVCVARGYRKCANLHGSLHCLPYITGCFMPLFTDAVDRFQVRYSLHCRARLWCLSFQNDVVEVVAVPIT